MAMLDDVKIICDRLAPLGWASLLKKVTGGALDIKQSSLAKLQAALTAQLASIDRAENGMNAAASCQPSPDSSFRLNADS